MCFSSQAAEEQREELEPSHSELPHENVLPQGPREVQWGNSLQDSGQECGTVSTEDSCGSPGGPGDTVTKRPQ